MGFTTAVGPEIVDVDPAALKRSASDAIDGVVAGVLAVLEDACLDMRELPSSAVDKVVNEVGDLIEDVPQSDACTCRSPSAEAGVVSCGEPSPQELRDRAKEWARSGGRNEGSLYKRRLSLSCWLAAAAHTAAERIAAISLDEPKSRSCKATHR